MTKMTAAQIKAEMKRQALAKLADALTAAGAEMYKGEYHLAIPVDVDGEKWVKVDLTAAQYTDTKVASAFDPFELQAEYLAECEVKAKEAEAKAKAKEEAKARKASKSKAKG